MSEGQALPPKTRRVQEALQDKGFDFDLRRFPEGTRTAADAAAAIGCRVEQIAKSLIFKGKRSGRGILVIASGANRVDEKKIAALLGEKIGRADADFVRSVTGFAIGGVPPVAHAAPLETLIDEGLLAFSEIWAAAGTPQTVFALTPESLVSITGGQVAVVKK